MAAAEPVQESKEPVPRLGGVVGVVVPSSERSRVLVPLCNTGTCTGCLARVAVTTNKERRCTGERPLCATRVVGEDSRRRAAPLFPSGLLAWCVEVQRANEGGQRLAHLGTRV